MASKQTSGAAWAAIAVVTVLVAGGWLMKRSEVPAPAAEPAPSPAANPQPSSTTVPSFQTASGASPAVPTLPPATTSAPLPLASPAEALRRVQLALDGAGTSRDMLDAASMLSACQGADMAAEHMYRERDQPSPGGQQLQRITGLSSQERIRLQQDFQRHCQVFDAATIARQGELFKRAYDGGARDAALPYLQWLAGSGRPIDPELRGRLQRDARQTAEDGDFIALTSYSFAFNASTLGITEVQRQAYKEAWLRIQGLMSGAEMERASRISMADMEKLMGQWGAAPSALSADQQREADALTAQVIDAWRKRQGKRG
ncbi:hypothetical protein [Roseateles sp.]|uniref:hypothetical protein n=1 Tax=Roseateles sp. TaxID=1971397 RepID=UPI0031D1373A